MHLASKRYLLSIIIIISFLMHVPHLNKELMSVHVWRQTQTQSTINNFHEEDMNILNPRINNRGAGDGIFRMEFPLMQWLVACLYSLFGNHLFLSRLAMFILGILSTIGLFQLLKSLFQHHTLAILGAWAFTFSPSFFYYTINPLPDNMALSGAIWGLALFFRWLESKQAKHLLFAGIFFSIGTLCKLPFIIYYIVPIYYFLTIIKKEGFNWTLMKQATSVFVFSLFPIAWYLSVVPNWGGNMVVKGMLDNTDSTSTILSYILSNLLSTLPELLLNYGSLPFFLAGFYFLYRNKAYNNKKFGLLLALSSLVLFYFFFEINGIANIHDYYLFPFLPLLFMLVAYGAYNLQQSEKKWIRYTTYFLLILLPLSCSLRMDARWDKNNPGFNSDLLRFKTDLRNAVPDQDLVIVGNDVSRYIFFYYINKKGWGFDNDRLTEQDLKKMISQGAKYLYTDSQTLYNQESIAPHLESLILQKGSIKIYSLR